MNKKSVSGAEDVKKGILALSEEFDIPIVATQDSHYRWNLTTNNNSL